MIRPRNGRNVFEIGEHACPKCFVDTDVGDFYMVSGTLRTNVRDEVLAPRIQWKYVKFGSSDGGGSYAAVGRGLSLRPLSTSCSGRSRAWALRF